MQRPVGLAAGVLAPSHLDGVGGRVLAADVVVLTHLHPAQAGEVALRLVGARAAEAERDRMVDALHVVERAIR